MAFQAPRTYEDFEPRFDWVHDDASNTLVLPLEGFLRNQLRVQVTSSRVLRVSGERLMEGNRWRRFNKEFPLPLDSDTNDIAAKFQGSTLYVRCPKLIIPTPKPQAQPPAEERQPSAEELASKRQPQPPRTQKPAQEEAASPKPTTRDQKAEEEAMKEKPETAEQKDYGQPRDQKGIPQGKAEARTSETEEQKEDYEERPSVSEGLRYRQFQNYRNSFVGLVGELKRQKKLSNLLVVILMVLLLGLYVKNSIKSSLGGSKTQDL